ncbi:hypothetical protein PFISCL1PPCAC_12714, partial [Pristionchus fissidentatus]
NTTICVRPVDSDFEPKGTSDASTKKSTTKKPNNNKTTNKKKTTAIVKKPNGKQPVKDKKDTNPTNDILIPLKYFYNWWHIRHAFCSNAACMQYINKNDVGFSPTFARASSLGRVVTHYSNGMKRMKELCPNSYNELTMLYFQKTGGRYVYSFKSGLVAGIVAKKKGVCGAHIPIKEYACRMSKDLMYAGNLEWNTFYKGLVRNGGKPVFYLWK